MSNCFTLTAIGADEPESLQTVDDKMREHFGAPPSKDEWYLGWYDNVGFALAMGNSWDKITEIYADTRLVPVIEWLRTNYTSDAWAERGGRR